MIGQKRERRPAGNGTAPEDLDCSNSGEDSTALPPAKQGAPRPIGELIAEGARLGER
jgi:hypothetical protein